MPLRHTPPCHDQSRSRLESWLHLVLLVALSTYFEAQFVYVGVNATDEGWILYAAMRLWDGGTLYDDVFFVFPPGHVLPAWIAYGLDAPGLVLSRWIYAGFNVALCVALYLLGRRITRPLYAFIAVAMVAVYSPYSHGAHFLFGYRYLVWSILALLAFSQRLRTDDHRWMMLAGALAGTALCFRLTPAFSVSVGIGFGILAASRDWRLWLRDGVWYTAGLLLVVGPVLAWLFSGVGPLVVWSEAVQRAVEMTKLQAVDMPPLYFPWGWERQEIQGAFVAVAFRAAPLVYVGYIVFVLTTWVRDLKSGIDCRRPLLIAIVFFGAVYLGRGFGRADQGHLDTAMPPVLLLLGHMLGGIESRLLNAMSARAATAIVATAGVALLAVSVAAQRSDEWMFSPAPIRVPIKAVQGRIKRWIYNNRTDPAVTMIKRSTRATDTILDLSASPLFSVLSGRRGPGYADIVMPGTFRDATEENRFVERLRADPPAFVLEPKMPFDARSANALALTAPKLTAWIEDNYGRGPETPHFVGRPRRPQPLSAESALFAEAESKPGEDSRRNLVLIVVDTLRPDHLGYFGAKPPNLSPHIDELAARAVDYTNAYAAAPWTIPSMASLFTSQIPSEHGVTLFGSRLGGAARTIAEVLGAAGWQTAGFNANHLLDAESGLTRGFDTYAELTSVTRAHSEARLDSRAREARDGQEVVDAALGWLDEVQTRNQDRPFFLYVHLMEPHTPYRCPHDEPSCTAQMKSIDARLVAGSWNFDRRQRRLIRSLYAGEVRRADQAVGRLLEGLEESGIGRDTFVVLTADHGERLGEHGRYTHGTGLDRLVLRVPLLLAGPGLRNARVETPVSLVDVAPTMLELLGLDPSASFRGESLLSQGARSKRPIIAEFFDPAGSFHSWMGREKPVGDRADEPTDRLLILGDGEATLLRSDGSVAMLDDADSRRPPGEHGPSPDDLLVRLGDWAPIVVRGQQRNPATEPISPGRREKLEALGYLTREPATPLPLPEAAIDPSGAEDRP